MPIIVITGAAGLIGSALVSYLDQHGCKDLLLVDRLEEDERYRNLAGAHFSDYEDKADFAERLARGAYGNIAAVVHLGACSSTAEADSSFLMRNNFAYTRDLARACLAQGIRFIYASSAATYGAGEQGYSDELAALPRLRPLNKYAFSKHAFDLWAWRAGAFDAITGLKYFNVFGPNEYHKGAMRSMALQAFEQIQASGKVRLFQSHHPEFADGEQERDFIYVADTVAMTAWFLDHPEATGLFNIGAGVARTWNDLAHGVFAALGRPPAIEYIPMPEALRARYQYSTRADCARLRAAGCAIAPRSLEAGVSDYVKNYLTQSDPYFRVR